MSDLKKYAKDEKGNYRTYGDIKPDGRLQELELIAFTQITGEEVEQALESLNPKLREEYERLAYGDKE